MPSLLSKALRWVVVDQGAWSGFASPVLSPPHPSHLVPFPTPSRQFVHKCRPFYIAGFNVDNLAEAMLAWSPSRAGAAGTAVGAGAITSVLNQAAAAGLNTVRTWAHTTNPKQPFQVRFWEGRGGGSSWAGYPGVATASLPWLLSFRMGSCRRSRQGMVDSAPACSPVT